MCYVLKPHRTVQCSANDADLGLLIEGICYVLISLIRLELDANACR